MITLFGIMPPTPSGIALYTRDLLQSWSERPVRVAIERGKAPKGFAMHTPGEPIQGVPLYMLGNNELHRESWMHAREHPGVVVLHDLNLHHLTAWAYMTPGDPDGYAAELAYELGLERGRTEFERLMTLTQGWDFHEALFEIPLLKRVVEGARAIVVHEDHQRRFLERHYPGVRVEVIAMGLEAPEPASLPRFERDPRRTLVSLCGTLSSMKAIDVVLEAVRGFPEIELVFCGRSDRSFDSRRFGEHRWIDTPSDDVFWSVLAESDLVVNLRNPSTRETSSTTLRAYAMGTPVAITRGSGDPVAAELAISRDDAVADLCACFERLCEDRGHFARLGAMARARYVTHHRIGEWSRRLYEFAAECSVEPWIARRRRQLDSLEPELLRLAPSLGWDLHPVTSSPADTLRAGR